MEFLAKRDDIVRVLKLAAGVANKRSTMPILGNVRLQSDAGSIRLSATDLTISMSATIPAAIGAPGDVTTEASGLLAIMQAAASADVKFKSEDATGWIEVKSGKSAWKQNGLPGRDFPALRDPAQAKMVTVDAKALYSLIDRTLFAASVGESQPHLQGVLFEGDGHTIVTCGVDGHKLATAEASLETPMAFRAVVPAEGCRQMLQVLEGVESCEIGLDPGVFFFLRLPTIWYAHKLLEERSFPPFRQVFPSDFAHEAVVGRDAMIAAVERVQLATNKIDGGMHYRLRPGSLYMETESSLGRAEDEIDGVEMSSAEVAFKANPTYVLAVLKHVPGEKVRFRLSADKKDPVVVEADDRKRFAGLIMPMV